MTLSSFSEPKEGGLETLIGSPPSVKSDEDGSKTHELSRLKRPLSEEDDNTSSPSKIIKKESDGEEETTVSEGGKSINSCNLNTNHVTIICIVT